MCLRFVFLLITRLAAVSPVDVNAAGVAQRPPLARTPLPFTAPPVLGGSRVWLGYVGTLAMSRRKPRASLAMIFLAWAKAAARAVIA